VPSLIDARRETAVVEMMNAAEHWWSASAGPPADVKLNFAGHFIPTGEK
jgi:hypothetical protein